MIQNRPNEEVQWLTGYITLKISYQN